MKKAMTILLTFIMVLQLIPIPAFATEEIATAEDLKAFLENPENVTVAEGSTLTVQISAENKLTKVSVFCDGEVRIKKDVTIPSAVKLQIPAATLYFHVDSTITVFGCIQDGRAVADRANGIVGEGDGKVVFTNESVYFQQGVTMINTSNTKLKLADDDSTITMYKNGHMMISSMMADTWTPALSSPRSPITEAFWMRILRKQKNFSLLFPFLLMDRTLILTAFG